MCVLVCLFCFCLCVCVFQCINKSEKLHSIASVKLQCSDWFSFSIINLVNILDIWMFYCINLELSKLWQYFFKKGFIVKKKLSFKYYEVAVTSPTKIIKSTEGTNIRQP